MKRPKKEKLYSKLRDLTIPDSIMEFRGGSSATYRIEYQRTSTAAYMVWPSGKPCLAINMYLLEKSQSLTGESIFTLSSKLSELIRYCAHGRPDRIPCGFDELNDSDIASLIDHLCKEVYVDDVNERLRDNNTVRAIMHAVFDFLLWYQDNLSTGRIIVGARSEGAAVIVKRVLNPHSNRYYLDHRYLPPRESKDPKLPIATSMIEKIEAVIDELEYQDGYSERALRRFGGSLDTAAAYLKYLTARRSFMIFMMRATGLRPGELVRMPVEENNTSVRADKPFLVLPTLKTRRLEPPLRRFPITVKQAIRIRLYLRLRMDWIDFLQTLNITSVDHDSMFLSVEPGRYGKGIGRGALTKDFEQLCRRAGFQDVQACFSMFRHKFITDQISMHLKAFDEQKGMLNKQDYRTLLEKVREKTGHRSVNSLWHYIDLVRDMAGVWEPVDKIQDRIASADHVIYELRNLQRDIEKGFSQEMTPDQIIGHINSRLKMITDSD